MLLRGPRSVKSDRLDAIYLCDHQIAVVCEWARSEGKIKPSHHSPNFLLEVREVIDECAERAIIQCVFELTRIGIVELTECW